jgi:hypothetical protein
MLEEELAEDEDEEDKEPEDVVVVLSLLHANRESTNSKGKICFIK